MATASEEDSSAPRFTEAEAALFEQYGLSPEQKRIYSAVRDARNMPARCVADPQEIIWAVCVCSLADLRGDMAFYERIVEERVRKLEEAERRYGWWSREWDERTLRRLIITWHEGVTVVDPALKWVQNGRVCPITWVREYFAGSYPGREGQTDEWKQECIDMYVLFARSLCRAYPESTSGGIVSFSDMQDFDWSKYDMDTKMRNADVTALIPNKLTRMISVHSDEKMRGFLNEMGPAARKKYGVVSYDTFADAVAAETGLPRDVPTFVGGTYRCDIKSCLDSLLRSEPEALSLMNQVYASMEAAGDIPLPPHMR